MFYALLAHQSGHTFEELSLLQPYAQGQHERSTFVCWSFGQCEGDRWISIPLVWHVKG
jgi:hypothetical protein